MWKVRSRQLTPTYIHIGYAVLLNNMQQHVPHTDMQSRMNPSKRQRYALTCMLHAVECHDMHCPKMLHNHPLFIHHLSTSRPVAPSSHSEQVCLASLDLLGTHLAPGWQGILLILLLLLLLLSLLSLLLLLLLLLSLLLLLVSVLLLTLL